MKANTCILSALCLLVFTTSSFAKLKALIIDGQNNHAVWPKSSIMMKQYLEASGLFEVDIDRTRFTWKANREAAWLDNAGAGRTEDFETPKPDPDFAPTLLSNTTWSSATSDGRRPIGPAATQRAFENYVGGGGGFVAVHAANNSFAHWQEYNRMIGIGGWGGRSPESGPHVYYDHDGKLVRDDAPDGKSGAHGARHEFHITLRNTTHPITRGLPETWLTSEDECYATLRGPAENMTVLATGKDISENAPTDRHEPMLMVIDYGKGRVFHTTLGHDTPAFEGVGFITTFLRGAEWAATGKVTQPVPEDFPTAMEATRRPFVLED